RVHRHPACAVGLADEAACRQRLAAVEDSDVVEAQKTALKEVATVDVLAVHPPGEVEHQLVEDALQKREVTWGLGIGGAVSLAVDLKDTPGGPSVHRRIHVTEIPFVGR